MASAVRTPTRSGLAVQRLAAISAALGGSVYGLALSRYLFEYQPEALSVFGTWPGVLVAAFACAIACIAVTRLRGTFAALTLLLPLVALVSPAVNLLRAQALLAGGLALFLALLLVRDAPLTGRRATFGFSIGLAVLLFLLYLPTVSPVVGEADHFEFQVSVARLGVAHNSGYPLLLLLGKLFERLPLGGTQAWRVNLSAAAAAALAAMGVMAVARRLGASVLVAFLAAFAFGVAPSVWARATEIEAYALNAALLTLVLYLGLRLIDPPTSSPAPLYGLTFVFGLALTNHLTILAAAPAVILAGGWWLWARARHAQQPIRFALRVLLISLLFFLLGLSLYLYVPIRWPAVNNGERLSLQQFVYILRGGVGGTEFDPYLLFREPQHFGYVFRKLTSEFGWVGFGLMVVGLGAIGVRELRGLKGLRGLRGLKELKELRELKELLRPSPFVVRRPFISLLFLLLPFAGFTYFVLTFSPPEPDFSDFFIPIYVIAAIFIALGLQLLITNYQLGPSRPDLQSLISHLLLSLFLLLPLTSIWNTLSMLDHTPARARYELGVYTLQQPLAPGAALLADPGHFSVPYWLQVTERVRTDLDIMVLPDEASYRAALDERIAAGQSVYLARYLPGLAAGYSLRSLGPLAEVSAQPFAMPPAVPNRLNATLADGIRLLGYRRDGGPAAGDPERLTLYWHAAHTPERHLAVYLRLQDATGRTAWQSAGRVPANGLYPTNAWKPGEYVSDFHEIAWPATLPPGTYQLQVGLFPPFQPEPDGAWAAVAAIDVGWLANPSIPHPLRARFGDQWLLGYAAPETALPDSPVAVTLYWLRGEAEAVTAFGERRSLAAWPVGAIVPLVYEFQTPATGDRLALSVATGEPARCGWLAGRAEGRACPLPPIRLVGQSLPDGAINYAGHLILRRAMLETPEVVRGDLVRVTLEWQALQTIAESYTVFVHLVGPDGRLYGQQDYWPVEGTRLTSSWQPGEIIVDPYELALPADAPAGDYTVHIGMYSPDTLERLPVLNADGQPLDDKYVLPGLFVR